MSQKTVAQLTTEINTQIATNGANAITASVMRPVLQDMVDSAANLADGQTLYTGDGTLAGNRIVEGGTHDLTIQNFGTATVSTDPTFLAAHFSYSILRNTDITLVCATPGFASFAEVDWSAGELDLSTGSGGNTANITIKASTGIKVGNTGEKVAFLGATPVVRVASADQAVATDPASTQTLANALRQALIDLGLIKGSA